jgi:hypothetical protein
MRYLTALGELRLEQFHLVAEDEAAAPQQPLEDLVQLAFEHAVLPFQRTERDRGAGGRGIWRGRANVRPRTTDRPTILLSHRATRCYVIFLRAAK